MSGPLVLAIESSCDETGIAIIDVESTILGNVVASQVALHAPSGGIVPEVAARAHLRWIVPVLDEAWADAGIGWGDIGAVAVTYGPGLAGSLLVGINFAKALAYVHRKPLLGINHLEGHLYAAWLLDPGEEERPEPEFPLVALIVSGGHTFLVEMRDHLSYRLLGQTVDDAAGEAFDKIARFLGLGFPGGPALDRLARDGDPDAIRFPRAMADSGDYDFSLSGLKTAVLRHVKAEHQAGREVDPADLAASFQEAIVDVQVAKTIAAARSRRVACVLLGGGVVANTRLRERMEKAGAEAGLEVWFPSPALCTDNGAMIALAGSWRLERGERTELSVGADPSMELA